MSVAIGKTPEQRFGRYAIDIAWLVQVVVWDGCVPCPSTLYPLDDDAYQDYQEDRPESSAEGNKYGNAVRMTSPLHCMLARIWKFAGTD